MSEPRTFLDGRVILHAGDCREVLKTLADNSVDSVVTDPPYHLTSIVKRFAKCNQKDVDRNLVDRKIDGQGTSPFARSARGFMGKQWDGGDIAFQSELWAEVLRVLKPGGYIMAFSSCRTYHRMACAIEDAGFITHPMFCYAFGSGFPKAHNLSKQLDKMVGAEREVVGSDTKVRSTSGRSALPTGNGYTVYETWDITAPATDAAREWDGWFYGTQSLKPAIEPVYFGQKPFERGLNGAQNVLKWGVGAINVGACKIPTLSGDDIYAKNPHTKNKADGWSIGKRHDDLEPYDPTKGRWPANLIHDGSEEVLACFPETASGGGERSGTEAGWYGNATEYEREFPASSGSAARFFASFPQEDRPGPGGGGA